MKKKIVYISGAEVFSANDVRAAFDEVRSTLNLDSDTILFGVPIDDLQCATESETAQITESQPVVTTDSMNNTPIQMTPVQETTTVETDSGVVPILSVLGGEKNVTTPAEPDIIDAESDQDFAEMLNDDMPVDSSEKTLEELLESMAPLREDVQLNPTDSEDIQDSAIELSDKPNETEEETDATLESLASEFAKVQDKMPTPKKTNERGKISKLKNILPFKKLKRDDSGIMGDLFGWAGIAANDEEFTIPGFFTNVASKK